MAIVSDIEIRLRADIARLQQDMDSARRSVGGAMGSISSAVKGATAAFAALGVGMAVGVLAGFIKKAIDATDVISDISQRTGIAVKDVAALQLSFKKGGMEASDMEGSMVKLSRAIADGNEALGRIGIKTKDAAGGFRSSKDVLYDVADAFENLEDGTQKTALAVEIFGKSGAAMIPLLNEGGKGLRTMADMAEKLGITFDEKTVQAAGDFNDTLDFLSLAGQGVARQVAAQLLPTLNSLAGSFLDLVTKGDGVRKIADGIGTGFKVLYTIGVGLAEVFNTVGSTLGAAAGQLVAILQGDFKTAAGIGQAWSKDLSDSWAGSAKAIKDAWSGTGGEVLEALVKTQHGSTVVAAAVDKDAQKQIEAYKSLLGSIREKVRETDREAAGLAPLNEAEKMAIKLEEDLTAGKITLNAAQKENVKGQIAAYDTNLKVIESNKKAAEGAKQFAAMQKELADARAADLKKATEEADANVELVATFGMTKKAIADLEVARLQEQLAQRSSRGLILDEIEQLEKLIVQKQRSAAAIANVDDLQRQKDLWTDIEKTAHDTFVSIADGGKGAAQRLKDTFKNIFFDWLYQQTLKKWIINLQGSMSSDGGGLGSLVSGVSNAFSSGGGGGGSDSSLLSNASGLLSAGKYLYQGFTTGFTSTFGNMISQLGSTFGSSAVSSFGAGMSGTAGMGANSAAAAGSSFASAIPIIGWIITGMMASNSMYKQGWDTHNGTVKDDIGLGSGIRTFDNILRGIGLSNSVANIFSGQATFARLFGRKNPEITGQGLFGSVGGGGVDTGRFADILEKGGWFRSDKTYRMGQYSSDEFDKSLNDVYGPMKAALASMADILGVSTAKINDFSTTFEIVFDKDETKRQQQIADLINGIGDTFVTYLIPNIAEFATEGEKAAATLQRVVGEFQSTNAIMQSIGVDGARAFGAVGLASVNARERLLALAGGVDALAAQTQFFAQNFLTQAEQIAPVQKSVTDQLTALGYAGVTTTEQFKAAVLALANSGALATEAGAKTYEGMLALAPAFKMAADYAEQARLASEQAAAEQARAAAEAAQAQIDAARAAEEAAAEAAKAIAEAAAAAKQAAIDAAREAAATMFSALRRAIDAEKSGLQASFQKVMEGFAQSIAAQQAKISKLQGLSSALGGTRVGGVAEMQAAGQRAAAQAQIASALALARSTGYLPDADTLKDALSLVQQDAADNFSSFADYQRDALLTQNSIEELAGITDGQLTVAQRTLASLEEQKALAQATYDAQIARLDGLLAADQSQLDAINGVNTSVLSVAAALASFSGSINSAISNPDIGGQATVTDRTRLEAMYQGILGRSSDEAGLQWWMRQHEAGQSWGAIESGFYSSDEYKQSHVYNAQQSATMGAATADDSRWQAIETAMTTTATATSRLTQMFDQVSNGGNTLITEPA